MGFGFLQLPLSPAFDLIPRRGTSVQSVIPGIVYLLLGVHLRSLWCAFGGGFGPNLYLKSWGTVLEPLVTPVVVEVCVLLSSSIPASSKSSTPLVDRLSICAKHPNDRMKSIPKNSSRLRVGTR